MNPTAVVRHPPMTLTTPIIKDILTIIGIVIASVVAVGQFLIYRQKGWKEVAESSKAMVDVLERRLVAMQEESKREMDEALAKAATDREFLSVRINTLEAQLAEVQASAAEYQSRAEEQIAQMSRLNHRLQSQLDRAEAVAQERAELSNVRYAEITHKIETKTEDNG